MSKGTVAEAYLLIAEQWERLASEAAAVGDSGASEAVAAGRSQDVNF